MCQNRTRASKDDVSPFGLPQGKQASLKTDGKATLISGVPFKLPFRG